MKRKLVTLMALLASLSLAQTTDSHTVTVNIPSVLQLTLDADRLPVRLWRHQPDGHGDGDRGRHPLHQGLLGRLRELPEHRQRHPGLRPHVPHGDGRADYGTVTVLTNRAQWTVKIDSISGPLTLGNGRVKVFAEKVSGKGASWTTTPTPITAASPLTLFNAGSGGQGRSVYKLYYLFTMDINDDIPPRASTSRSPSTSSSPRPRP
jgi:hypothetical protein